MTLAASIEASNLKFGLKAASYLICQGGRWKDRDKPTPRVKTANAGWTENQLEKGFNKGPIYASSCPIPSETWP